MWLRSRRPVSPRYATAADAVRYLASVCDGAVRRDGHGFSSDHASFGHWLADLPVERWTTTEHAAALQLVGIYRKQLTRAGFDPADILSGHRPRRISKGRRHDSEPGGLPIRPGYTADAGGTASAGRSESPPISDNEHTPQTRSCGRVAIAAFGCHGPPVNSAYRCTSRRRVEVARNHHDMTPQTGLAA